MKKETITCEVIQDLLPLYEDGCCSEQSGKIVKNHLAQCPDCRKKSKLYRENLPMTDPETDTDLRKIKRGVRKITRWKRIGIASLCLLLLVFFAALPAWNYVQCEGLTYTNLNAAYTAYAFKNALIRGEYEKAYGYLDIKSNYEELLNTDLSAYDRAPENKEAIRKGIAQVAENGYDWYEQLAHEKFLQSMNTLEELNETLTSCSHFHIITEKWGWIVSYDAVSSSGQQFRLGLNIKGGKIDDIYVSNDYLTFDFASGDVIIDEEQEAQLKVLDRFYRFPTTNETTIQTVFGGTDWDWTMLFDY